MRFALRDVHGKDNYEKLDTLYMLNNPWNMDALCEQYRFAETNRFILENFNQARTLLEVGCGEGHQSIHLLKVCDQLVGLDVSKRAVDRARKRSLKGEFIVGDVFTNKLDNKVPFDLVVACEVLYYMRDVPAVLQRMRELGRNIIVTYFENYMSMLDPVVLSYPGVDSGIIRHKQNQWRVAWMHVENNE